MLKLIDLFELEVIATPGLGIASSHGVGGFQQLVTEIAAAGFDELGVLGSKVAGLVLSSDKTGIFGHGRLGVEAVDMAIQTAIAWFTELFTVTGRNWNCCCPESFSSAHCHHAEGNFLFPVCRFHLPAQMFSDADWILPP